MMPREGENRKGIKQTDPQRQTLLIITDLVILERMLWNVWPTLLGECKAETEENIV